MTIRKRVARRPMKAALYLAMSVAVCAALSLLSLSCNTPPVKIGLLKKDLRGFPAVVAREMGYYRKTGEATLVELDDFRAIENALSAHRLDAAYVDVKEALTAVAAGGLDIKFLVISTRKEFKPETALVAAGLWAGENPGKVQGLIKAHRNAVRMIGRDKAKAAKIAAHWLGVAGGEPAPFSRVEAQMAPIRFEGGMDRAALIDVLDDLRASKAISPQQADALALELVREEAIDARPDGKQ